MENFLVLRFTFGRIIPCQISELDKKTDKERARVRMCKRVYKCRNGGIQLCVRQKQEQEDMNRRLNHPYVAIVMVTVEMT